MKRKIVFGLLWGAAGLATLLALFYAEEDWRGARAWAACEAELKAKGEPLKGEEIIPTGPDRSNLAKKTFFSDLSQGKESRIQKIRFEGKTPHFTHFEEGTAVSLEEWQKYFRSKPEFHLTAQAGTPAQDVLAALSPWEKDIEQVDSILSDPEIFVPMDYKKPYSVSLFHLGPIMNLSKVKILRADAYLQNGELDRAMNDFLSIIQTADFLKRQPFLINILVSISLRSISEGVLWEGIHHHQWSEAQLIQMELALRNKSLLSSFQQSLRGERSFFLQLMSSISHRDISPREILQMTGSSDAKSEMIWISDWRPSGWLDLDRTYSVTHLQKRIDGIDVLNGRINPAAFDDASIYMDKVQWTHLLVTPFSLISLPALSQTSVKVAADETFNRFARISCYLEQYWLKNREYPDRLDQISDLPVSITQEVVAPQPFHYRKEGKGYLLYSVGWNLKDEGGKKAKDRAQGDWCWCQN